MKPTFFIVLILYPLLTFGSEKFQLSDFAIQLEQITSDPSHIWVNSGYTTIHPKHKTVMGVEDFFSPPFTVRKFNFSIRIQTETNIITDDEFLNYGGDALLYAGGTWFPHKIVRQGAYHHQKDGKLVSLGITSELIPLFGKAGFIEKVTVINRAPTSVTLKVLPELVPGNPGLHSLAQWGYSVPQPNVRQAIPVAFDRWANESVHVGLYRANDTGTLASGQSMVTTFTVIVNRKDEKLPEQVNAVLLETDAIETWQKRLETYTKNIPALTSDIDGLDDYYLRSIVSGLVCIWENPSFTINPFLTESGMDGGAICTYHWGIGGYYPQMACLMLDTKVVALAKKVAFVDLEQYYAFTLDGTGVGVKYSYDPWSYTNLVSAIFKFITRDKELFGYNKTVIQNDEKRKSANNLIDYGLQHNLLEMRGAGWEHYVVSPNAERSWSFQQLAEMGKYCDASEEEMNDWKRRAGEIRTAVRNELWDDKAQWFASVYPDGFRDYVYSIQVYDAMRVGVCTPAMEKVLVSQLNDQAFLGSFGVSSVSQSDSIHFEVLDPDWSGSGAYSGDGPILALTMYEREYPEIAWDILKRHFWMGKHFIYYPQEHYCYRPMSPAHKRANVASGLAGAEAILFGLIGFQPQYNGELYIHPQLVVNGAIHIKDFVYRHNSFDVSLTSKKLTVRRGGKTVYEGSPKRVKVL